MRKPMVAVIGQGGPGVDPWLLAVAGEVGAGLAAAGVTLVCGGLGGVMTAVARGAAGAGGTVVGILPGDDPAGGNAHLTVAIPTGMGEGRNVLVVRAADAVIAIGGGYGTLAEIGLALKTGRTVVGVRTWELSRAGETDEAIVVVDGAEEAVAAALGALA